MTAAMPVLVSVGSIQTARTFRSVNDADAGPPLDTSSRHPKPQDFSEDAAALSFVRKHTEYRYVAPWHCWLRWDGVRWQRDSTGNVYECIRNLVREAVQGDSAAERRAANSGFVAGVERLLQSDQRLAVLPEQLDADPWLLNTLSGIVDLRTGRVRAHDPLRLCTKITNARVDKQHGADLWSKFIADITLGDNELASYLQRVAGYFATGVTTEDVLVFLFGYGSNGKSSFAEALAHTLGDYAKTFPPEVLMESKGERHLTELAQFKGVRFALTSEPSAAAQWNDSRIKSLTGDATISARLMRCDFFEFPRTHKTLVVGNHKPRLNDVSHAMRTRVQMVPFRAVFDRGVGASNIRGQLKSGASGAILAWIVEGARLWHTNRTAPPECVRSLTEDYLNEQDTVGQWLQERCERRADARTPRKALHTSYSKWCQHQELKAKAPSDFYDLLDALGFTQHRSGSAGRFFGGLALLDPVTDTE